MSDYVYSISLGEHLETNKESICLTPHNNMLYYDASENVIDCFGLYAKKSVKSNSIKKLRGNNKHGVTRLVYSEERDSYLIGYDDGVVQEINIYDL